MQGQPSPRSLEFTSCLKTKITALFLYLTTFFLMPFNQTSPTFWSCRTRASQKLLHAFLRHQMQALVSCQWMWKAPLCIREGLANWLATPKVCLDKAQWAHNKTSAFDNWEENFDISNYSINVSWCKDCFYDRFWCYNLSLSNFAL